MKIALSQINMKFEDKICNFKLVEKYIKEASINKSDIIIFPEMTCTGFSMNNKLIAEDNNYTRDVMINLAKRYNIIIFFGQAIKFNNDYYNNFVAVDSKGELFSYNKIHPFTYEANYYSKGNEIVNFKIEDITFTPFICYDLRFPEIFQVASIKSQVIVVIASWPKQRDDHWLTLLKARAIENQCYIIGVNRVGKDNDNTYVGHSCIFNSNGELLNQLSSKEQNIYIDINLKEIEASKLGNNFKKDRRIELYKKMY